MCPPQSCQCAHRWHRYSLDTRYRCRDCDAEIQHGSASSDYAGPYRYFQKCSLSGDECDWPECVQPERSNFRVWFESVRQESWQFIWFIHPD